MEKHIPRRTFLKQSAIVLGGVSVCELNGIASAPAGAGKSAVFFTRDISVDGLLKIYAKINEGITGKIGIKLHTGEPHGPDLLPIAFTKGLQPHIPNSAIVECNVLYAGPRQQTATHRETLKTKGLEFSPVDIMDADGDARIPIPGMRGFLNASSSSARPSYAPGEHVTDLAVGKNLGSWDILAIDKASIDLIYARPEEQRHDIVERIESRGGLYQLEYMKTLQMGTDQYELIAL